MPDRVLIDTSAFYALHSAVDRFHDRANVVFQDLMDTKQEFWTTSYTLVETSPCCTGGLDSQLLLCFWSGVTGLIFRCCGSTAEFMTKRGSDTLRIRVEVSASPTGRPW